MAYLSPCGRSFFQDLLWSSENDRLIGRGWSTVRLLHHRCCFAYRSQIAEQSKATDRRLLPVSSLRMPHYLNRPHLQIVVPRHSNRGEFRGSRYFVNRISASSFRIDFIVSEGSLRFPWPHLGLHFQLQVLNLILLQAIDQSPGQDYSLLENNNGNHHNKLSLLHNQLLDCMSSFWDFRS